MAADAWKEAALEALRDVDAARAEELLRPGAAAAPAPADAAATRLQCLWRRALARGRYARLLLAQLEAEEAAQRAKERALVEDTLQLIDSEQIAREIHATNWTADEARQERARAAYSIQAGFRAYKLRTVGVWRRLLHGGAAVLDMDMDRLPPVPAGEVTGLGLTRLAVMPPAAPSSPPLSSSSAAEVAVAVPPEPPQEPSLELSSSDSDEDESGGDESGGDDGLFALSSSSDDDDDP